MGFFETIGKAAKGTLKSVGGTTLFASKNIGAPILKGIGTPTVHAFKNNPGKFLTAVGVGTAIGVIGADMAGENKKDSAIKTGAIAAGAASIGAAGAVTSIGTAAVAGAIGVTGIAAGIGKSMIRMPDPSKVGKLGLHNLSEIKLNKKVALPIMALAGVIGGVKDTYKAIEKSRMGMSDGMVRTATPMIPRVEVDRSGNIDYGNTGATGDLVFAMHNNR